jgi:acetyltransferase
MADPKQLAERIIDISKKSVKPILTSLIGEQSVYYARQILNKNGIPTYPTPEDAVESYMHLYNYARNIELLYETPEELNIETFQEHRDKLNNIINSCINENREILNEVESKHFLESYGIESTKPFIAKSEGEAIEIAAKIGYPVVMKVFSPQITHKCDVGGIALGLKSKRDVRVSYYKIIKNVKELAPDANIIGVTIQKMIENCNIELILGSKRDPLFGSIILFGLGGIYTELFKDRAIGFPPLNQALAHRIIEQTKAYELLKGFRSLPPADMKKIEETLIKFSQLIIDNPIIKEIDINPLLISKKEISAVDARIIIDKKQMIKSNLIINPYPRKYMKKIKLKDGTDVLLRPIKPEDELLWLDMFKSFSEETVRYRFFRIIKETPHEMRTRYCNIDYDREIGIVAEIMNNGRKRFIGVIRMIVDPRKNYEAEFAIVVSDKWQKLGLGSEFFNHMFEIAKDKGLEKIYGTVLSDNMPMLKLCREKNFKISYGDPGEYKIEYELFNNDKILLENGKILNTKH